MPASDADVNYRRRGVSDFDRVLCNVAVGGQDARGVGTFSLVLEFPINFPCP